jgi:hypothetical protein
LEHCVTVLALNEIGEATNLAENCRQFVCRRLLFAFFHRWALELQCPCRLLIDR